MSRTYITYTSPIRHLYVTYMSRICHAYMSRIYPSHTGVTTRLAQGCCAVIDNVYHHLQMYVGMCDAGCGMCAVPVDGLHKEDMTHEQLLKIQSLLKRRIPTGIFLIPVVSDASFCMRKKLHGIQ